jgi:hypothetical protein
MQQINTLFASRQTKAPNSRRSDLIDQLAKSIDVPFQNIMRETYHLKDDWGCDILQNILDDVLSVGDNKDMRARKLRELINASKPKR